MQIQRVLTALVLAGSLPTLLLSQPAIPAADRQAALLKRYCIVCHNNAAKTGGLSLERFDIRHPASGGEAALETWEKVIRKVRVGMMPPRGAAKPGAEERASLVSWLESELDRAAAAEPPSWRRGACTA